MTWKNKLLNPGVLFSQTAKTAEKTLVNIINYNQLEQVNLLIEYIDMLASTNQGENDLLTLEALQIKDIKRSVNTKDESRSRALRIRI